MRPRWNDLRAAAFVGENAPYFARSRPVKADLAGYAALAHPVGPAEIAKCIRAAISTQEAQASLVLLAT